MLSLHNPPRGAMRGFSLIEMMIAITIGLIVMAGAITVIVAIGQSNSETIQSTRLTQELRTLATVIANDVKRARHLNDPVAMVGQGAAAACPAAPKTPSEPCYTITPAALNATASCITYGYTGTTGKRGVYNYNSIRYVPGASGSIVLDQLTFDPATAAANTPLPTTAAITACPVTGAQRSSTLNSPQIDITALSFTRVAAGQIELSITGKLRTGSASTNAITRTFVQPVFIRSGSAQ